jgi:hypothetical protein
MTGFGQDIRFGLRQLRRSASFVLSAVVTLVLGIGANVIALGVLNAVLLKPLDVPRPARLYNVEQQQERQSIVSGLRGLSEPGPDVQRYGSLPAPKCRAEHLEREL